MPLIQRLDGIHYGAQTRFNAAMRRVYARADAVVFQSEFSRRVCTAHFGPPPGRASVILNGTDLDAFAPAAEPPAGPPRLIASAYWRPQKRLRDTLAVFAAFRRRRPDATLEVLGDVSRAPDEALPAPGVTYRGHVPRAALAQRLRQAHVFLHLSWFDPCPNGVLEALACGLPVVHTPNGGTRELVPEGCGALLSNEPEFDLLERDIYSAARIPRVDPEEGASAIEMILSAYSVYRQRLARHRHRFGAAHAAASYRRLIESEAGRRAGAGSCA
jgi:glycosyltransferase involved in cell wall biosynthesis